MTDETTAFDDQDSTFIIPSGGGFQIIFCPPGRSTTILTTMADQIRQLKENGKVTPELLADTQNLTLINSKNAASGFGVSDMNLGWAYVLTFAVSLIL